MRNVNIQDLFQISIIIPTRDRPKDLAELLISILNQDQLPLEIIIIDDSSTLSAKPIATFFSSTFKLVGCKLKYIVGSNDGLPAARNLGIKISKGDYILFLDDDILLDQNVISAIANFMKNNPDVMGVQPRIIPSANKNKNYNLARKLENAIHKVFMLSYHEKNSLKVRRSGMSVFPSNLTKTIIAQRLSGCCCCYRREIFNKISFDTNLKRVGYMEDLDFSYRVYKANQKSLYVIPNAKIIHKTSPEARLHKKLSIYMTTIYWFYIFFKDIFQDSILNLVAFLWALIGNIITVTGGLIVKRKPKSEWWHLLYLINSYIVAFKNLKNILMHRLEFFNKNFNKNCKLRLWEELKNYNSLIKWLFVSR